MKNRKNNNQSNKANTYKSIKNVFEKKGIFSWYFDTSLVLRIFIALILGAVLGIILGPKIVVILPFGNIFVRLLKMIVIPVILFSLVVGASSISPSSIGRIGVKIVVFYLVTSALAVLIGLVFGNIFQPGVGMNFFTVNTSAGKDITPPNLVTTLLNIIPTNPFGDIAAGKVLPLIFFAILFGLGIAYLENNQSEKIRSAGKTLISCFEAAAEVMYSIVRWILEYAPIGVFALIAVVFGEQGAVAFGPLGKVTLALYLGLFVHLFLVYGVSLMVFRLSLFKFLKKAKGAMITAYVTRSSSGSLPVTLKCADNLGISRKISSFTLPLGATINMDGTAIYQGVCVLFIAQAVGLPLSFSQQLTVIVTAVLASIGTAGVPGAGSIMLLMVLNSVGLPVEEGSAVAMAYAMILGIEALLDMGRTSLNVTGDLACSSIIAKLEKGLDKVQWDKDIQDL